MIDNNYFDSMEVKDYKKLCDFNDQVNWFTTLDMMPKYNPTDSTCIDSKGRMVHLELKTREGSIMDYMRFGDILVEPKKLNTFTNIMESGFTNDEKCLYVNFVDDGIIIFNFNDITNIRVIPNHRHYNKGKQEFEFETRFAIPINKAIIYKNNQGKYKRIQ